MLIEPAKIYKILQEHEIKVTGVLHVGAHECEEQGFYAGLGLCPKDIIWIDALEEKVTEARTRGVPNVYQAVVSNKDGEIVKFNVSNNVQSSSILEFGTHAYEHPQVHFVKSIELKTTTLNSFFKERNLDASQLNFWNFDIQGAELLALHGATDILKYVKAVYLEVNTAELYKGCALIKDIDAFLASYGFIRELTDITRHGWGDALYIRY